MAAAVQVYSDAIRKTLEATLCLRAFPSEIIEKQSKPEIELNGYSSKTRQLVLSPIYLCRGEKEKCVIEPSINSTRISFSIKALDEVDKLIGEKFAKYLAVRADYFEILRRKPIPGYDISFLILDSHLEKYSVQGIINFIIDYVENIDKDLSDIKLNINTQARITAACFVGGLANQ
ncbi:unnamed protein product [Paramecium octaurelia]|uniref:Actin-related protein 2/3 complex subunit 4 n=1 Tax=Paramecium octaurelia TaxID=43137 RepID=A0A8S1T0W9_PAROT|nr:unnamed protein product [Paramecium octaurelia]